MIESRVLVYSRWMYSGQALSQVHPPAPPNMVTSGFPPKKNKIDKIGNLRLQNG